VLALSDRLGKDTTSRAEDFAKLVERSGGRVRELLWTVGEYDIVAVADFPTTRRERRPCYRWVRSATYALTQCGHSMPKR
jgi:hypothetical protein